MVYVWKKTRKIPKNATIVTSKKKAAKTKQKTFRIENAIAFFGIKACQIRYKLE
jgi:hypothetical protein